MGFLSKIKDAVTSTVNTSALSRMKDIMSSNIGALLEKSSDPVRTVDHALRQARADLAAINKEADIVIANEHETYSKLLECAQEAKKYDAAERRAQECSNYGDVARLRETKMRLLQKLSDLNDFYKEVHQHADDVRALREKLASDVELLEGRANLIKGKAATAKARERAGRITSGSGSTTNTLDRMDALITKKLDTAKAAAALDEDSEDDLLRKYQ